MQEGGHLGEGGGLGLDKINMAVAENEGRKPREKKQGGSVMCVRT